MVVENFDCQFTFGADGKGTSSCHIDHRAGTVTITDLLNAQTLHRQSQDKFVDAYGQFQLKRLAYLQATGR